MFSFTTWVMILAGVAGIYFVVEYLWEVYITWPFE